MPRLSPGVRSMAASALGFSLMAFCVKLAGERLPAQEMVLARAVLGLVLSLAMLRAAGVSPWGERKGPLVLRGLLGFGGLCCFFYAVVHLPLAEATVIQYTSPALTALLAALLLRERLRASVVASTAISIAGLLLVTRPALLFGSGASSLDGKAAAIGFAGAGFSALAYVLVRRISQREHPLVIVFYFPLVAVPLSIPAVAPVALWPTPTEWILLVGVGVFTQIGQVYLTRGLQLEPAGRAMALSYLQVVFATLWGFLAFREVPDAWTIAGSLLILAGTALATLR